MNGKNKLYFFSSDINYLFQFITLRITIAFVIVKTIYNECDRDTPIRLLNNNECTSTFSNELYDSGGCIIDNTIIKKQWLNNIIFIKESGIY